MTFHTPEEIRGPDDSQVFGVHVSDGAEGCQVREVSHEVLQSPVEKKSKSLIHIFKKQL